MRCCLPIFSGGRATEGGASPGAALSPGENFTLTGQHIRQRSPFVHTLICGDSNGLFSYIGTDDEIDRGGFETDIVWRWISYDGVRLAPAKGASQRVSNTCVQLLKELQEGPSGQGAEESRSDT